MCEKKYCERSMANKRKNGIPEFSRPGFTERRAKTTRG
jgi:hypothetical protein